MLIMVAMQGGSSGAFLQSIIAQWITQDQRLMRFGDAGDCHDYKRLYEAEYIQPGWQQFPYSDWTMLKRRVGIAKSQPIVVWSRCLEPWDQITVYHDPWHHVFIHVEWMEKLWTATNHYYKMRPQFAIGDQSPIDSGYKLALERGLVPQVGDLAELTTAQSYELIKCQQQFEVDHSGCFRHSAECQRLYPGRRTDINFLDIMIRPDRVFDRLAPIVDKQCQPIVYTNYAAYLAKQYELIKNHAPWLHERLMPIRRAIDWCERQ